MSPDLPNFFKGNDSAKRGNSDSERHNKIVWVESEDVYKPIPKSLNEFTAERGISDRHQQVYIKAAALDDLEAHLRSNLSVEQGGILFGNAYSEPHYGIYVEITAAVAAPKTIGTGAHLEFTSDSWLSIMNYARSEHPQENIVGWYHSHPNLGVFMSGTDMNTQRAFFHHPWCLSIVYDPVRKEIGYFLGEGAVRVNPVIFGRSRQQIQQFDGNPPTNNTNNESSEQRVSREQIGWIEGGDNRQFEHDTDRTNRDSEKLSRSLARRSSVPLLFRFALIIIVVLAVLILLNNIFNNTISSKPVLPFNAYIKTMPMQVFSYLDKEKKLLRYEIVKAGDKIGGGDEITLLFISLERSENYEKVEKVKLVTDEFSPKTNVKNVEVGKISDLIRNSDNLLDYNYSSPKEISMDFPNAEVSVMVPMFSSSIPPSAPTATQGGRGRRSGRGVSASQTSNNADQPKRVVRDVVYIPRRIEYKDSNNKTQEIEIKEILKDGK